MTSQATDYLSEDTIVPKGQNFVCISFLSDTENKTTMSGIKIRGVFSTIEQASEHAKTLQSIDKHFNVFVGEVGKWLPYDPAPTSDKAGNPEYAQDQLNNLMKGYLDNQNKAKIFEEKRKIELMRNGVDDAIKGNADNMKELQQELLESQDDTKNTSLKEKVTLLETQIKELESRSEDLMSQETKLQNKLEKLSVESQPASANSVTV
jgi:hypothetical protein